MLVVVEDSCCFVFISLFRLFTFCPSILSSTFGVRFRRTLSVVDNFFNGLLFEPNKRNGDVGIGLKSRISISGGFAISCCERFYNKNLDFSRKRNEMNHTRCKGLFFVGDVRFPLSTDSLR